EELPQRAGLTQTVLVERHHVGRERSAVDVEVADVAVTYQVDSSRACPEFVGCHEQSSTDRRTWIADCRRQSENLQRRKHHALEAPGLEDSPGDEPGRPRERQLRS